MPTLTYQTRRGQLEDYFDRTAVEAWSRLTSDAPVGRIRATVRAGRDEMRRTLLDWLPKDLSGRRVLDAGCGTGAFAIEAARRGARVVAVDLSPNLVQLARERTPSDLGDGQVAFIVGDMSARGLGRFDHVVAMDSLIHYKANDVVRIVARFANQATESLLFTFAPKTIPLTLMHSAGLLFPRNNRAPAIEPVSERALRRLLAAQPRLTRWQPARSQRVANGFYTSQAMELRSA